MVHVVNKEQKRVVKIAFHGGRYDFWKEVRSTCGRSRCRLCHKLYARSDKHFCPQACAGCARPLTECPAGIIVNGIRCTDCNRFFKSPACFAAHQQSAANAHSMCQKMYNCPHCDKLVIRAREPNHECGRVRICKRCKERVPTNHDQCFWNPPTPAEKQRKLDKQAQFKIIAFDLEVCCISL